jgi:hypothetical protein
VLLSATTLRQAQDALRLLAPMFALRESGPRNRKSRQKFPRSPEVQPSRARR